MGELESIRVFLAVAEQQSFAGAARQLALTPASVTRTIAALEDRLGVQLLSCRGSENRSEILNVGGKCATVRCFSKRCGSTLRTRGNMRDKRAKLSASKQALTGRSERIRTSDPLLPKQVRYQAALRSDR